MGQYKLTVRKGQCEGATTLQVVLEKDTDNDGICDKFDNTNGDCILGVSCDDGDVCTTGDVYDANCNCAGTFQDSDNDGICDATDSANGDCILGASCDDGDVCTTGDVYDANCNCTGTFQDSDNDGICDANDSTNGNCMLGAACDDGDMCTTGERYDANCNCVDGIQNSDCATDGGNNGNNQTTISCDGGTIITYGNGSITMSGGSFYQVFDASWREVYNCAWNCDNSKTVSDLNSGEYRIYIKDENYQIICNKVISLSVTPSDPTNPEVPVLPDAPDNPEVPTLPEGSVTTCGEISIVYGTGSITMTGQNGQTYYFKVNDLNSGWAQVFGCAHNCSHQQVVNDLPDSKYLITIYNADWSIHCDEEITMTNSNFTSSAGSRQSSQLNFEAFNAQRAFDMDMEQISIYPNPVQNVLNLSLKPLLGKAINIQLINIYGKVVQSYQSDAEVESELQLELDNTVNNGLYQVVFEVEGQKTFTKRLVVVRLY